MKKIKTVKHIEKYKLKVEYEDGLCGEVNLEHLKSNTEYKYIFKNDNFLKFKVDDVSGDIVWTKEISICKNALYEKFKLQDLAKRLKLDV